ncbi:MAG: glucose 1-dehydrogenase [Pseudomonadota bacterium]
MTALEGKTAIVTGGGRDIGRACAEALAEEGAAVAISYRTSGAGAEEAVEAITAKGGRAFAMACNATDQGAVEALVARAVSEFGGVDVLVNNVGGLVARKTMAELDMDHWATVMDLNLTSAVFAIKAALPHMAEGGAIVNIASQAGRDGGGPGAIAYATAKGAMMTLTRGLAKELGPKIRVNAVCPGMISTGFHDTFTPDEARARVAAAVPLKREGRAEEIGKLVAFLASDQAAYVNGASIDANGGALFS